MLRAWEHDSPEKEKTQGDAVRFFNLLKIVMCDWSPTVQYFQWVSVENRASHVGVLGISLIY